jgi:hypothetical protein
MLATECIVPARNAESTVAGVVAALLGSGRVARVIVADLGSADGTGAAAAAAGAQVVAMGQMDRCQAIRALVPGIGVPILGLFDATLISLTPERVAAMIDPVATGQAGMVCGLHDYGASFNKIQGYLPIVTNDRVVLMSIMAQVPADFWRGHRFEIGLNETAARMGLPVFTQLLYGVNKVPTWQQVGLQRSIEDLAGMTIDVLESMRDAQSR